MGHIAVRCYYDSAAGYLNGRRFMPYYFNY